MSAATGNGGRLIAVDGADSVAVRRLARSLVRKGDEGGISHWNASGIFDDLDAAENGAGHPSARTLVLLYAADLAFRLRWEIRPALADGHVVVAAPYVDTAVAFGLAADLDAQWLNDLFGFASEPSEKHRVPMGRGPLSTRSRGMVEYACHRAVHRTTPRQLLDRTRKNLRRANSA